MTKRVILAPLAVSVAASLGAPTLPSAQASIDKTSVAASKAEDATGQATATFVLTRSISGATQMADHYSHSSHASHASHYSGG